MFLRKAVGDVKTLNALFVRAEEEALDMGDEMPGPEHLLLAALRLEDDSARDVLAGFGVTADDLRSAIKDLHAQSLQGIGIQVPDELTPTGSRTAKPHGAYMSTGSARDAFQRAAVLSKSERPKGFRAAHVVQAVAEIEHGTVARVLNRLGVTGPALIAASRARLDQG